MIDYMVMEAVMLKVKKEDERLRKEAERSEWKSRRDHLKKYA